MVCTICDDISERYARELADNPSLARELERIRELERSGANGQEVAERAAELQKKLEAPRTEAPPTDTVSNRSRPPRDGDTNYVVENPANPGETITDIDKVGGGTLWEEKTATGQDPRINTQNWVQKHVLRKLDSYVRARQYLAGYENAPLGIDFTQPGATPEFKAAVEQAVQQWKAAHPGVEVTVRWAS
jgi:hypothetical protein